MKRWIWLMCLVLACFTQRAAAQWTVIDPSNLVQNIKSAVQSSTTASNMIKSLQESVKIYNQSKAYYDALKAVHNIIKDEIKWSQHKAVSYLSTIELRGIDRTGILLDLANVISRDFSINIREVGIHSHDGIFEGSISLYVKDAEGLHDVMDKLRKIKGIESVKRTLS